MRTMAEALVCTHALAAHSMHAHAHPRSSECKCSCKYRRITFMTTASVYTDTHGSECACFYMLHALSCMVHTGQMVPGPEGLRLYTRRDYLYDLPHLSTAASTAEAPNLAAAQGTAHGVIEQEVQDEMYALKDWFSPDKESMSLQSETNRHDGVVVGDGVEVRESNIEGAGLGLFASRRFRSRALITRYEPDPKYHGRDVSISKEDAQNMVSQTHLATKEGLTVAGITTPIDGLGGGSFANDPGDGYNAEAWCPKNKLGQLWLRVKPGCTIEAGQEIYWSYGRSRSVAMGFERLPGLVRLCTYAHMHGCNHALRHCTYGSEACSTACSRK